MPSIVIMTVVHFTGIIFTQIELEYFYEDIVRERVDSRPWVKPIRTAKFSTKKDLLFVTHLGLLQPTTSFVDVQHPFPHWNY